MDFEEGMVIEDLGAPALPNRFITEDKGENVARMQNLLCMFDSLPPRLLTHRRGGGTNELPLLNVMLSDYTDTGAGMSSVFPRKNGSESSE
jgi:hypothetical protein